LNSAKQNINLKSNIPFASWDSYLIKNGKISGTGTKDSVYVNITAAAMNLTDSTQFLQPNISVHSSNDRSNFSVAALSKSALEEIMLKGMVQTFNDGIAIKWQPSYFILNQKKWDINNAGSLVLRKNNVKATNLSITQGIQEFVFSNSSISENALQLELKIQGDGFDNKELRYEEIIFRYELGIEHIKHYHREAYEEFVRISQFKERYDRETEREFKQRNDLKTIKINEKWN
jgi:hypothetical protein